MKVDLYIGPLIERRGKFSYDTFTLAEGMRSSFQYPRVGDARYDRRALAAESEPDPRCNVRMCETLAEFEQLVATARDARQNLTGKQSG
jgi:hypothetical protein